MNQTNKVEVAYHFFNEPENYLKKGFGVRVRAEIVRSFLGDLKGQEVMDIGCGDGSVSLQFLAHNNITLLDLAENMLARAKGQVPEKMAQKVVYFNMPFSAYSEQKTFDVIIALGLLAHVPSIPETLEKIKTTLKPTGQLVLQFTDYDSMGAQFIRLLRRKNMDRNNAIRRTTLLKQLDELDFSIVIERRYSLLLPGMGQLPNAWLYQLTKASYENQFLSRLGTDYICLLKHKA